MSTIHVYTDGGCYQPTGVGAWAFVWRTGVNYYKCLPPKAVSNWCRCTTNNRMELQAVLFAAEHFKYCDKIVVHTDSQYVITGATKYVPIWRSRGWRSVNGRRIKNKDLWEKVYHVLSWDFVEVVFEYVRGHSGDELNDAADAECTRRMVEARYHSEKK